MYSRCSPVGMGIYRYVDPKWDTTTSYVVVCRCDAAAAVLFDK